MRTISSVVIASLTVVGVASAQPKPGAGAPATTPAPKAGAPAVSPERQKAVDEARKAGVIGKKVDANDKAVAPAPPATPPKPPAELTALAKSLAGTWRCKGQGMDMGMAMVPMTATLKTKADLDGYWIQDTFDGKIGKQKLKFVAYTSYDAAAKKWRRVMVDSMGMQMIGTSDGTKDSKTTFNLDTMGGGGPSGQFRDHTEMVDKRTVKAWGEATMDKGKTWTKVYEMDCKK